MPPDAPGAVHTIEDVATTEASARGMRADAQRNRERIIAAAIEVFAESGLEASTAEVAHRAGVGEATLFRRFPSKDALIEAIVETQMDGALAIAADCLEDPDPGHGLERFLLEMVERSVADRGVLEATKNECVMNTNFDERRKRFLDLAAALVRRAQRAGAVREDLSGQDLGILIGLCSSTAELPFPGLREDLWKRYVQIVLDGLRPEGATKLRPPAPARRVFEQPQSCDG